jgi:hypothetical protein
VGVLKRSSSVVRQDAARLALQDMKGRPWTSTALENTMDRVRVAFLLLHVGCTQIGMPASSPDEGPHGDASTGTPDAGIVQDGGSAWLLNGGVDLMGRLAGLWSGPALQTPLGDFAMMNVDFRDVTPQAMFGRVDLDAENNLRFAFWIENHHDQDLWVYRNGGYFQGVLRDTRASLISWDTSTGTYRFCAISGGCDYIDALYNFDGEETLTFDVRVRGHPHLLWNATRKEIRELPAPFPADLHPLGGADTPFPQMSTLQAHVTWSTPLQDTAYVWILLSTTSCPDCEVSRSISAVAHEGAIAAEVLADQLHGGSYLANVVLDRNRNMGAVLGPDAEDGVAIPNQSVVIADQGQTQLSVSIFFLP